MRGTKGDRQMAYESAPPTVIDLNKLTGVQVSESIFNRGTLLYAAGKVRRNTLYPWKFTVSGDEGVNGITLYFVDLSSYQCSCMWFVNTGTPCKHIIAALISYQKAVEKIPALV